MCLPRPLRYLQRAAILGILILSEFAAASAQSPVPLKTLSAVKALTNQAAARSLPVAFQATVTFYEKGSEDLFVQDGQSAIYVETDSNLNLTEGDRVLVEGTTQASFRPEILGRRVTVLRHGTPPSFVPATFTQLIRADLDCRRVKVQATVRAANIITSGFNQDLLLDLSMPGGNLQAQVSGGGSTTDIHRFLDSEVELTAAVAGKFDGKLQMTGVFLEVPGLSDVRILKAPALDPSRLPIRLFDEILQASRVDNRTERVRVQGTITYYQPGSALVLQDGHRSLWVDTLTEKPHAIGERVFVSGFPDVRNGSVVLTRGEIEARSSRAPLDPEQVDSVKLSSGIHSFDLVSVEGQLVTLVREAAQDQYVIVSQGHVFSAIYRHPERGLNLPISPLQNLRPGSRVRVNGICVLDRGDQFHGPVAFHILLRDSADVLLLAEPSIVSIRNLGIALGLLLSVVFVLIGRALLLERKVHRQSATTEAAVERWRNRVMEGINDAIPLPTTLLQITELLSLKLQAKYCWAEIENEGRFGNYPPDAERHHLQVFEHQILGRSGAVLGTICAASSKSHRNRFTPDACDYAARLAALAIETGGKYSDLVRRSELDPLTNAKNRFALGEALDRAIEQGKTSGEKFGLVYIDLDGFKEINDQFGHNIGDRYLKETADRLRHQLRSDDILARMGGDEFAILVTGLTNGAEIHEIAARLEDCFRWPFCFDTCEIVGSASVGGAVYPEDAVTVEALLECADTRMYASKRQKPHRRIKTRILPGADLAPLHQDVASRRK